MTTRPRLDREAVLRAAEETVGEAGWPSLTMAAVAARVGVRVPSLYNHVQGLDDLRAAVQVRAMEALSAQLRTAAMGHLGEEGLLGLAHAQRAFALRHRDLYLAATTEPLDREAYFAAALPGLEAFLAMTGDGEPGPEAIQRAVACFSAFHGPIALECAGFFDETVDTESTFTAVALAAVRQIAGSTPR